MKAALEDRFWTQGKVEFTPTCWNWADAKDSAGYGWFRIGSRKHRAHRVAYELSVGPIPAGLVIDHICHNPSCVKPEHLRAVTQKQNLENHTGPNINSTSGVRGVSWNKLINKWDAAVVHHGKQYRVGFFTDLREAELAVIAKRNELFTHNDADRMDGAA